jgi:hypothetical protein
VRWPKRPPVLPDWDTEPACASQGVPQQAALTTFRIPGLNLTPMLQLTVAASTSPLVHTNQIYMAAVLTCSCCNERPRVAAGACVCCCCVHWPTVTVATLLRTPADACDQPCSLPAGKGDDCTAAQCAVRLAAQFTAV